MSSWIVPMVLALTAAASTALAAQIDVKQLDRAPVLKAANAYLKEEPITVTAASSPRSAGGKHDLLLFGGLAYDEQKYLDTWKMLEANPTNEEVLRNLPIREPVLWVE